ncbi:MAG: hypothetical protein ACI3XR_08555 [Eubacteriales bacterium]
MWNEVCYLCEEKIEMDAYNRPMRAGFDERAVFCSREGIKRTEFYQAQSAGFKPSVSVLVPECDYNGERYIKVGGRMYKILRSYPVKGEKLEIIGEGLVNDGGNP